MNKLTRDNLQEFCRTCLSDLRERQYAQQLAASAGDPLALNVEQSTAITTTTTTTTTELTFSYNVHLLPNLRKLLVLLTTLDISDEEDDAYPKSLCQLCYDKMIDFQEFRQLALRSADVLYAIVNNTMTTDCVTKTEVSVTSNRNDLVNANYNENILLYNDDGENMEKSRSMDVELKAGYGRSPGYTSSQHPPDDAGALSTSPAPTEKSIKTELIDTEEAQVQESPDLSAVKTEIDSEYEEEENSTFYEKNALGTSNNDSIGDDADDEEHALRNGAANSSSAALNNPNISSTSGRQRAANMRKRKGKSLKCPRCDKQVYKKVYLDAHIRGVHEGHEKPFLCLDCEKAFTRYNQLHLHMQSIHLISEKFNCDFEGCEAAFRMRSTLETHRKLVHISSSAPFSLGLQEIIALHQAQQSQEMDMDHICQQCRKKYSSRRALSEHLKRHLQIKTHVCKECGVAKVTRTELQTHMRTHQPNLQKFKCTYCPQEFNHKNSISRHVRTVHEGQRCFPCNYCSKRFATRNSQVCHERLHTGERPFTCEICQKGFAQVEGLKSHMKNHDKNLRKHVCSFCAQRFITRKNLVDHEKRHRGDKPHICNTCNKGFFLQEDLQAHSSAHARENPVTGSGEEEMDSDENTTEDNGELDREMSDGEQGEMEENAA